MFITGKYTNWYYAIISNAQRNNRKKREGITYESHHIIPRSFGGSNKKGNRVLLTCREHVICHLLLVRMVKDTPKRFQMIKAVTRLFGSTRYNGCYSSRTCARMREEHSISMSGPGNPRYGKPGTMLGKTHSTATKKLMGEQKKGELNSFFGKKHNQKSKDIVAEKNSKSVLCITNGIIYKSQSDAARQLNLHQGSIAQCVSGDKKSTGGFTFSLPY
jgi:hypothetical protein